MYIRRGVPADLDILLEHLASSVRATHTFLSEDDIRLLAGPWWRCGLARA